VALAAKKAGIGERTLWRWLKDPVFADACNKARADVVSRGVARFQHLFDRTPEVLAGILDDSEAPASVKLAAVRAVWEITKDGRFLLDFEERLGHLETLMEGARL
jgi:hypothetical protein